jgi:hypothetical protein
MLHGRRRAYVANAAPIGYCLSLPFVEVCAVVNWFLVETKKDAMPRWCQVGPGGDWVDGRGMRHVNADQRVFLHRAAEHDRDLLADPIAAAIEMPMAADLLLKPDSESGWVSPDGRFWGCGSVEHEWLLHALVRRSVHDIGRAGWIRMAGDIVFHDGAQGPSGEIYASCPMNQKQMDTLFDLGFHILEPWPKRLPIGRREQADRLRPFAVRSHHVPALVAAFVRAHPVQDTLQQMLHP